MSNSPENSKSSSSSRRHPSSRSSRKGGSGRSKRFHRLNEINFLNIGYCCVSTLLNVGVGLLGLFGLPTYAQQSGYFPTLISPAPLFITGIWTFIYTSQALFTIFQTTRVLRARAQIQDGIRYFYGLASLFQVIFTITYCTEMFWASLLCSFGVIAALRSLISSQAAVASDHSWTEFWLLHFPFRIHLAWIVFVAVLNSNIIFVYLNFSNTAQIVMASISAAIIIIVSFVELFTSKKPLFVIPFAFCYGIGAAAYELFFPTSDHVRGTFRRSTIICFEIALAALAAVLIFLILIRLIVYLCKGEYKQEKGRQKEEVTSAAKEGAYVDADKLPNVV